MRRNSLLFFLLMLFAVPVVAEDRIAWVIGNERYSDAPLKNPENDAKAISEALKRIGFKVTLTKNASLSRIHSTLDSFGEKAKKANVAIIYYAGHGIQIHDKNYLIPTNFSLKKERDLRLRKLVSLDSMIIEASQAKRLGVVMVDACRDNPFQDVFQFKLEKVANESDPASSGVTSIQQLSGNTRSLRGLARVREKPVNATRRVLVSLATEQGMVAYDGQGENSPYAKAILDNIESTQDIRTILRNVKSSVVRETGGAQNPYLYTTLDNRKYCLTARCEDGTNGIDSDRVNQKYSNQEIIQMQQKKRLEAKQKSDKAKLEHERKLMKAKQEQIKKHREHKRKLKLKQIEENRRRQQRVAKQAERRRKQLEKNRKHAWELEKKRKLRNQQLRLGITPEKK